MQMSETKPDSSPGRATQATKSEREIPKTYAPASPVKAAESGLTGENGRKVGSAADPVGQQLEQALARWKTDQNTTRLERELFDVLLALRGRA